VVFTQTGALAAFSIFAEGGRFLGEMRSDAWFETQVPAGRHAFGTFNPGGVPCLVLPAELEAGKTYYVLLQFISPAHGVDGPGAILLYAAEAGLDPGTPVPPADIGLHFRVKRRREQVGMDAWKYLQKRQRLDPALAAGQSALDEWLGKANVLPGGPDAAGWAKARQELMEPKANEWWADQLPWMCRRADETINAADFLK
jgi:hypothetical protein